MTDNPFAEEWRECLRAHYMHVIRVRDRVTEPSLTVVMGQAGFSDAELAELRVRATMHVDDVADDFTPDLDALAHEDVDTSFSMSVPEIPVSQPAVDIPDEAEMVLDEPDEPETEPEPDALYTPETLEDDADAPQQLSLF
jgi:hypothetical protein